MSSARLRAVRSEVSRRPRGRSGEPSSRFAYYIKTNVERAPYFASPPAVLPQLFPIFPAIKRPERKFFYPMRSSVNTLFIMYLGSSSSERKIIFYTR
ncbi:hypothetical protein EVAR_43482_1 [Eumeta japonica]|uniref:Uncharacterized protein n=1 Tax=Eumeta variegata TaxID=151549 RepID=A0A4C1YHD8_EUMVA|nr:hypothetical protein EVAR_43482_1 [Eumeta japonica]